MNAHRRRRLNVGYAFVAPVLVVLVVINLYPALYQVYISLTSYQLGLEGAPFVGLANYGRLFQDARFWNAAWVTFKFLLLVIPTELLLGLALAQLLYSCRPRKYFLPLLLLPMVTTPIVVGYIFQYMFREDYGLISYFLRLLHLFPGFNLTANPTTVVPALAFVDVWQWTPFAMLVLLAGLESLPTQVFEAARVDGASALAMFRRITLPMLRNQLAVVLLFRTVDALRVFDIIFAMTRGGPGTASESVSIYLQLTAFRFRDLGYSAAIGMFLLLIGSWLAQAYLKLTGSEAQLTGGEGVTR